ncbi:MAG: photosynthetic reaction center subunit H [Beijerinckiaceae bacterium]
MGTIVGSIDLAQVVLYAFWIFFAGLILYLRREDKREGYPLESDRGGRVAVQGFPAPPTPKAYRMSSGQTLYRPDRKADTRPVNAQPIARWPGAPLEPNGDPMLAAVGPGSYAERVDKPEMTAEGHPSIVPMRVEPAASVDPNDADPRGMAVVAADRNKAGVVVDLWIDRGEPQIRYIEVETNSGKRVLLPMVFALIDGFRKEVKVDAIMSNQFDNVPATATRDVVTKLEEDRIAAYFGAGLLYATPKRTGDIL